MSTYFARVIIGLASVLDNLLWAYKWVIIIRAFISFVNPDPYNPIVRFLYQITDPVLYWIRRNLPVIFGGLDFSPLIVIFGIWCIQLAIPMLANRLIQLIGG
jgi:YggT family protein